jgi:hypothetical protein
MKINIPKANVIYLFVHFNHCVGSALMIGTGYLKELGALRW